MNRTLLPDDGDPRFTHEDLDNLTAEQVWAEAVLVQAALAERIYTSPDAESILTFVGNKSVTEVEWLRERLKRLKQQAAKQKSA